MERCLPPELIVGYDDETLEGAVGKILMAKNLTLSTAESCTGGYLAHLITSVPGSSGYYQGSVISYANEVKMSQLKVKQKTLHDFGAVSEETVREMVAGALNRLQSDVVIATSGIAGPDGGTPDKLVGTVWIAVGNKQKTIAKKLLLGKDRLRNIQYSSFYALNLLRHFLNSLDG